MTEVLGLNFALLNFGIVLNQLKYKRRGVTFFRLRVYSSLLKIVNNRD